MERLSGNKNTSPLLQSRVCVKSVYVQLCAGNRVLTTESSRLSSVVAVIGDRGGMVGLIGRSGVSPSRDELL